MDVKNLQSITFYIIVIFSVFLKSLLMHSRLIFIFIMSVLVTNFKTLGLKTQNFHVSVHLL